MQVRRGFTPSAFLDAYQKGQAMCLKCTEDGREYAHLSDLAMMLTEAFNATNGADMPIIVNDNAGDRYWNIFAVRTNTEKGRYEVMYKYSSGTE